MEYEVFGCLEGGRLEWRRGGSGGLCLEGLLVKDIEEGRKEMMMCSR